MIEKSDLQNRMIHGAPGDLRERVMAVVVASGLFSAEELSWARVETFKDGATWKVNVDVSRVSSPRDVVTLDLPFAMPEYIDPRA